MGDIAIIGAGGRAGRAAVNEARRRGHKVTAVVRDPERHAGLAAGAAVMRDAAAGSHWLIISPAGDFLPSPERSGRYRIAPADAASRISYADVAVALLDEADSPRHHRVHIGVEAA